MYNYNAKDIRTGGTSSFEIHHDMEIGTIENMSIDSPQTTPEDSDIETSTLEELKEEYWPFLE